MKALRTLSLLTACCALTLVVGCSDSGSTSGAGDGGTTDNGGEIPEGSNATPGGTEGMDIDEG